MDGYGMSHISSLSCLFDLSLTRINIHNIQIISNNYKSNPDNWSIRSCPHVVAAIWAFFQVLGTPLIWYAMTDAVGEMPEWMRSSRAAARVSGRRRRTDRRSSKTKKDWMSWKLFEVSYKYKKVFKSNMNNRKHVNDVNMM